MDRLKGKTAFITGAARGLGFAMAKRFHEEGAEIIINDLRMEDAERAAEQVQGFAVAGDVSSSDAVATMYREIVQRVNRLDILVNNAGIAGPTAPVEEIDPDEWRRSVGVNLNGAFYCTRLATPLLKNSPKASIINISSVAGCLGFARRLPYASSKWAMIGFTESLAKELGPSGIRVNALLPGIVEGPRIEGVFHARAESEGAVSYTHLTLPTNREV